MRQRAGSLRLKLTLWYLLVFSGIQLLLVGTVILVRRDAIWSAVDDGIERSAAAMVENILVASPAWDADELRALVPADAGFELFCVRGADGEVLASHGVLDPSLVPFSDWEVVPAGPIGDVFTQVPAQDALALIGARRPLRLITMPFRSGEELFFLQAAVARFEGALGPYAGLFLYGVPAGMIAALAAAWLIAGRAVDPLRRLSRAAQAVAPDRFGERLRIETSDDEVSLLQAELNEALGRLERGYRAQEEFISNVSHELRTPLAVLLTESQVLRLGDESPQSYRDYARRVEEEMKRLAGLVNTFLELTRADLSDGFLAEEEVALNDVVLDAVEVCSPLARRKGVRLLPTLSAPLPGEDGEGGELRGDASLLVTMLDNLVRNAIDHSVPGDVVELEVRRDASEAEIRVRDQGEGIPEEFLGRVFERFVRVPERVAPGPNGADGGPNGDVKSVGTRRRRGSGLGLAIARQIAELHGGGIEAANLEPHGCCFTVRIPLRTGAPAPALAPA